LESVTGVPETTKPPFGGLAAEEEKEKEEEKRRRSLCLAVDNIPLSLFP